MLALPTSWRFDNDDTQHSTHFVGWKVCDNSSRSSRSSHSRSTPYLHRTLAIVVHPSHRRYRTTQFLHGNLNKVIEIQGTPFRFVCVVNVNANVNSKPEHNSFFCEMPKLSTILLGVSCSSSMHGVCTRATRVCGCIKADLHRTIIPCLYRQSIVGNATVSSDARRHTRIDVSFLFYSSLPLSFTIRQFIECVHATRHHNNRYRRRRQHGDTVDIERIRGAGHHRNGTKKNRTKTHKIYSRRELGLAEQENAERQRRREREREKNTVLFASLPSNDDLKNDEKLFIWGRGHSRWLLPFHCTLDVCVNYKCRTSKTTTEKKNKNRESDEWLLVVRAGVCVYTVYMCLATNPVTAIDTNTIKPVYWYFVLLVSGKSEKNSRFIVLHSPASGNNNDWTWIVECFGIDTYARTRIKYAAS